MFYRRQIGSGDQADPIDPGCPDRGKHPASTVAGSDQAAAAWGWEIFQCQGSSSCNLAAG
jgi:hypothetical protein